MELLSPDREGSTGLAEPEAAARAPLLSASRPTAAPTGAPRPQSLCWARMARHLEAEFPVTGNLIEVFLKSALYQLQLLDRKKKKVKSKNLLQLSMSYWAIQRRCPPQLWAAPPSSCLPGDHNQHPSTEPARLWTVSVSIWASSIYFVCLWASDCFSALCHFSLGRLS